MSDFHKQCLLCESPELVALPGYEKYYLVKCRNCSFVFSRGIPSASELTKHYEGYLRAGSISPITIKRYEELIETFEKYAPGRNILDIGCGDGYFLEVAKKRGWNTYGTEFTTEAVEICRTKGIHMHQGILSPADFNIRFDIITSFEVIEHINNPKQEIRNIHSLLSASGLFYFTTPNFNSLSKTILKDKWNVIEYPEHLSYYTPATIHRLLKTFSFKKIELHTTGISIKRFKQSINADPEISYSEEGLRQKTETSPFFKFLKRAVNFSLDIFKKGDTIKGLYKKS